MKLILALIFVLASLFSFSQNEKVKLYYQAHNEILEKFARTIDTARYLDNMYYFILQNGKQYIRLTHHNSMFELAVEQKNWKLAELILEQGYKHNIANHLYQSDSTVFVLGKYAEFYNRESVKEIESRAKDYYPDLIKNVNLLRSIELNVLAEIDQFGRHLLDEEYLDTSYKVRSAILTYTDSTNLVKLYNYIEKHGFPDQDEIGFFPDFVIMLHTYMRPCNSTFTLPNGQWYYEYFDSVYYQEVLDGNYRNLEYAYMRISLTHNQIQIERRVVIGKARNT
jgi:hypothetical protein